MPPPDADFVEHARRIAALANQLGSELRRGFFAQSYETPSEWGELLECLGSVRPEKLDGLAPPAQKQLKALAVLAQQGKKILERRQYPNEFHELFPHFCTAGLHLYEALKEIVVKESDPFDWATEGETQETAGTAQGAAMVDPQEYLESRKELDRLATTRCRNAAEGLVWSKQGRAFLDWDVAHSGKGWTENSAPGLRLANESLDRALMLKADSAVLAFLRSQVPPNLPVMSAAAALSCLEKLTDWCRQEVERTAVEAFELLRDRVCEAVRFVCEIHRKALSARSLRESLADVARGERAQLLRAVRDAQSLWSEPTINRYLERTENVYLDDLEGAADGKRVSGSCYHDLALGAAVSTIESMRQGLPAIDFVEMMRYRTAAGDDVGQGLVSLVPSVRTECRSAISRWKAATISALQASVFSDDKLDPSRCPGCKAPVPEEYSTMPKVPCQTCGRWELDTGLRVMAVAGPPGIPPEVVRLSSPFWRARLPDRPKRRHLGEGANDGGTGGANPPLALTPEERKEVMRKMNPANRKAYFAFEFAQTKAGKKLQDPEAYKLLKDEGIPDTAGDRGELTDYELPRFDTFARQLRKARRALREQKYTPRQGRSHGPTIVEADEIEQTEDDQ